MPTKSILYEICLHDHNRDPVIMSSLSGHKTYSDILKSKIKIINTNQFVFFNISEFIHNTLQHLKDNFYI